MKNFFRLNKVFSILNLVLVCILGYFIFSLISCKTDNENIINSRPESAQRDIKPDDGSSNSINTKTILEHNIFGPANANASQESSQKEIPASLPAKNASKKPLDLRLLGTVAGDENTSCAIIEDTQTRIQDLYKIGDVVQGARIDKIERNRIILFNDEVQEVLNLYVGSENNANTLTSGKETKPKAPESAAGIIKETSPTEREVNKSAFLAKVGGIEAIMKTVEITPNLVNGKSDGLKISGLEGLSMAKFVGLENGDVIHTINGQTVTNDRKAFQVLRKARSLSSLDLELTRGTQEKTLSFKIQ